MGTSAITAVSVILLLLEVGQLIILMIAATIAEMRCHNNDSLRRLLYPSETALRRAPIAGTLLFQALVIVLDINRVIGDTACPGMLMTLALPCTIWTFDLFIGFFRYQYVARATGLSTSLQIPKDEPIIDLSSFHNGTVTSRGIVNAADIQEISMDPEFVWELYREAPSDNDTSGDKVYHCYSVALIWHALVFMIAASQNYRVVDRAGECSINDVEVKLFFQSVFALLLSSLCSIARTRSITVCDPEFLVFRRTAYSVVVVSSFAVLIIFIPGTLAPSAFGWIMFILTTAWTSVALVNLSPFLPELEKWAVGWVTTMHLPKTDCMGCLSHFITAKHKSAENRMTDSVTITFEPDIKEKHR